MMNVYNGNVTTDARGFATVKLPRYFGALNRDFRYQLTQLGRNGWDAKAGVSVGGDQRRPLHDPHDKPNVKVSWQVTGIRKDAYANTNRVRVESAKTGDDRGMYLHPELFGKSAKLTIGLQK